MIKLNDVVYCRLGTTDLTGAEWYAVNILGLEVAERRKGATYFKSDHRAHTLCYFDGDPEDQATGFARLLIDENYAAPLITEFGLYSYKPIAESKRADGALSPEQPEDKHNHAINALEYWTRDKRPTAQGASFARPAPDLGEAPGCMRIYQGV